MAVRVVLTGSPWQKLAPNQLDGTQVIMRPHLMLRAAGSGGSEFSSTSKARLPTEGRRQAGECSAPCDPDINGDGFVEGKDLAELLSRWGSCY